MVVIGRTLLPASLFTSLSLFLSLQPFIWYTQIESILAEAELALQ